MFTIGNDELANCPLVGETIKCKICGEIHNVEYGDKINSDGTKEKSDLAFIKCPSNGNCYLVGIVGKEI